MRSYVALAHQSDNFRNSGVCTDAKKRSSRARAINAIISMRLTQSAANRKSGRDAADGLRALDRSSARQEIERHRRCVRRALSGSRSASEVYFHFIPTRPSWPNQAETWFSILPGQARNGASFIAIKQIAGAHRSCSALGPVVLAFRRRPSRTSEVTPMRVFKCGLEVENGSIQT